MNYKTTIILLAVVGALILAMQFIPDLGEDNGGSLEARPMFPTFGKEEAARVELRWLDATVTLVQVDGEWWLLRDEVRVPADAERVSDLLEKLQGLRAERSLEEEDVNDERLKQWGLNPARFTIVVALQDGDAHELGVGRDYRPGSVYARAGDGRVGVISDAVIRIAGPGLDWFRARKPVRLKAYMVSEMVVTKDGRDVLHVRLGSKDLEWRMKIGEEEVPGGREDIESLRSAATDDLVVLEEGGFVADAPEDLSAFGLSEPAFALRLVTDEGASERTILVGAVDAEKDEFFWMIDGEVCVYRSSTTRKSSLGETVPGLRELLGRSRDTYRDPSLLRLGAFTTRVAFSSGPKSVAMVRQEEVWSFEEPEGRGSVESARLNTFVEKLREMELVRYADDVPAEEAGFGEGVEPTARLELRFSEGGGTRAFRVGKVLENGDAYLRRETEGDIVVAPETFLEALRTDWFRFRRLAVHRVSRPNIVRVDVYRSADGTKKHEAVVRDGEGGWKAAEGMEGEIVVDAMLDLLAHVCALKAEDFVDFGTETEPVDAAKYGLDEPEVQVQVTLKEGDETKVVRLDLGAEQRVEDEVSLRYAQLTVGDPNLDGLVFTLGKPRGGQEYRKVLTTPLLR